MVCVAVFRVMHAVLTPVGSAGDVFPLVMLGRELRSRGHRVTVMAVDVFRDVILHAGLEFASAGTREEFETITQNPDLWHPRRGPRVVFGEIASHMRRGYDILEQLYVPGESMLIGHSLSVHTRVFEETHRVPAATVHLAPSVFRSDYAQPALPSGHDISGWPRWAKQALWWVLDRAFIDPLIVPELNAWRSAFGLAPMSRLFKSWINSPQLVLGLFPDWFGVPQPDWPPALRLTGFVLSGELGRGLSSEEADRLDRFLGEGSPPVVFTPGSANQHADQFLRAGIEATVLARRRALLVTPYRDQLPGALPADVAHFPYVPFSTLFPRTAAVVHHGGIGTSAQVMAAGVPHVVMPMGFDQPDNAARLERLELAAIVQPKDFTGPAVAAALDRVITSARTKTACEHMRGMIDSNASVMRACDLIEEQFRINPAP